MCESRRNVCVMDKRDCDSKLSHVQSKDRFLNTTCRYHVLQRTFACKWIYLSNIRAKTTNSFIFSQQEDFRHCPTILNPVAAFNLNIISKDIINNVAVISEDYTLSLKAISQPPRPVILSVNATETSLNVTWTRRHWHSTKCQICYKASTTEQCTVLPIPEEEEELEILHVIDGLKPFSQYRLTVACSGNEGVWSDWSEEFQGMTLEAIPTAPPYVSFYVEPSDNRSKPQKIILIWRALEAKEARGVILGYKVTCTPTKQPGLNRTIHTQDQKAILEVTAGDCPYDLTVMAYNTAGLSPPTYLQVSAGVFQSLPKVKGLWAHSEASSLMIRWETAAVNVSEFAIEWFSTNDVASKQWRRLNGSTFSTVLTGDINPLKNYSITVYSLYGTLCAPPETIQASLEHGTLLEIVQLQPVNVTKASITVQWVWQKQSSTRNVLQYRLVLSGAQKSNSLVVFPHQWQHSFLNLQTNTKYTVSIYGETTSGNFSKANIEFTTLRFESDEIIKAAVPVVLLILAFSIFSVLSRTVYKNYFFPKIANPGHSLIGHWLLNPSCERETVLNVLKMEDFLVNNQFSEKSIIHIEPKMSLGGDSCDKYITMSNMSLHDNEPKENADSLENSFTPPGFSEYVDLPLLHANFSYV
ncbi:interleukin-6 receptor subunit beta [Clarias gariepinus]|uniref:interleukin-31 receptor subunit alpha n=1 Tax=Clarias gariepinus TaxID=13013 RepID=UPI00234D8720|nr:interleukin-31 receptor subunit alpha [Clarias gariepinus]